MATAEQIKALVRCYSEGDQERFLSVTMQIAAHAARAGKDKLAQELREMVDDAKKKRGSPTIRPVPIARPVASWPALRSRRIRRFGWPTWCSSEKWPSDCAASFTSIVR